MCKPGKQEVVTYTLDATSTDLDVNLGVLHVCLIFLPFSFCITIAAIFASLLGVSFPPLRDHSTRYGPSKKVLVTGVGMAKGLFLARTLYLGGCIVIGADFEHHLNFHCGRFSRAVNKYLPLKNPSKHSVDAYIAQVVDLILHENIDLWISCSGVATAIEDARLARVIEESTSCRAFQLNEQAVSILDDKMEFMKMTSELKLSNLEWHSLNSPSDVQKLLQHLKSPTDVSCTKYIVKSASMDDLTRGSLPILRSDASDEMEKVLMSLTFEKNRTWILQEYVDSGEEYCTQAVVVGNKVLAFTACRSASVLMHYSQLDPDSFLFKKMLRFTNDYISGLSKKTGILTGHISFDFLIRYQETDDGFSGTLAPIECNPRCHTATVLFRGLEHDLADRYLSTLQPKPIETAIVANPIHHPGFYWMGHDLIALMVLPLLRWISSPSFDRVADSFLRCAKSLGHFVSWKDPTFEWWDPLPWFVLNHLYWPLELFVAAVNGTRWKELNMSTTKIFSC